MSKESLKKGNEKKAWNKRSEPKKYHKDSQPINKRFLIICEGETEEDYFKAFPVVSAYVKPLAKGEQRQKLVESAIREKKKPDYKDFEVWVVFDLDITVQTTSRKQSIEADFDAAVQMAKQHGIKIAYSNDNFELWFLLHYESCGACTRTHYYARLTKIWEHDLQGASYDNDQNGGKKEKFRLKNYARLLPNQAAAISRAKAMRQSHLEIATLPSKQNPCTTVYDLVEELNKYLKK
jgi:hypothetical protein